jgi:N-acetylglucosamine-6-sulfatase
LFFYLQRAPLLADEYVSTRMSLPSTETKRSARTTLALLAALATLAAAIGLAASVHAAEPPSPPNIVFILTDDQTATEVSAMPNVQALVGGAGTTFRRAYAPYPLCCPTRATLLGGQHMHNHGVRGNFLPFGGWDLFRPHESNALPVWTHEDGYYNVHVGKYMNGYAPGPDDPLPVPKGWDEWYGKISEDSLYFNYQLVEKTGPSDTPELRFYGSQPTDYQSDALGEKAEEFIRGLTPAEVPFTMNVWFNAPHGPFEPAPRHLFTASSAALPPLPGFNEKNLSDKPRWLRKQAKKRLGKGVKKTIAVERRRRIEQLLSVDEAVREIVDSLKADGILDETYIIFASDNGFFRGEHRIVGGKYLPYEPAAKVPLMIRGPGIPAGGLSDELVSLVDVPQTILDITGSPDSSLDGRSLLPYAQNPAARSARPLLLEGDTGPGGSNLGSNPATASSLARTATARARLAGKRGVSNLDQEANPIKSLKSLANAKRAPAYKAIRTDRYLYVLYANGQTELYDMHRDPAQLRSLATNPRFRPVRKYLFSALVSLAGCAGANCNPELAPEPLPLRPRPNPKKKPAKSKPPS